MSGHDWIINWTLDKCMDKCLRFWNFTNRKLMLIFQQSGVSGVLLPQPSTQWIWWSIFFFTEKYAIATWYVPQKVQKIVFSLKLETNKFEWTIWFIWKCILDFTNSEKKKDSARNLNLCIVHVFTLKRRWSYYTDINGIKKFNYLKISIKK